MRMKGEAHPRARTPSTWTTLLGLAPLLIVAGGASANLVRSLAEWQVWNARKWASTPKAQRPQCQGALWD